MKSKYLMNNGIKNSFLPIYFVFGVSVFRALWAVFLFVVVLNTTAYAEKLVSTELQEMPSLLVDEKISNILTTNDRVIALGQQGSWLLNEEGNGWESIQGRPNGNIRSVVKGEERALLLLGQRENGPITTVAYFNLPDELRNNDLSEYPLPRLPIPLRSGQGVILDETLYVAGISLDSVPQFHSLDLLETEPKWASHAAWPLMSGNVNSGVAQNGSLFITITGNAGVGDELFKWSIKEGWAKMPNLSGSVVSGSARKIGQGHILYIIKSQTKDNTVTELKSYYTVTGSWVSYGQIDAGEAHFAGPYESGVIWGQLVEGGNGASFSSVGLETGKQLLHSVDWFVIAVYLVGMLGIGIYFYTRHAQNSQSDFFLGGRSIPFWAAGISLYASNASSISYIAVPAKAFATNWNYLMSNLIVVLGLIFVAIWIVPLLRRLNLTSIFQYLETRFHPSIRILSSALFIVFQLGGRMTIILFLPSMAIATVTGFDVGWSIIIMGGITIIYTVLGGMKAVIWTDVIQLFVMFGGTFFAIGYIFTMLDGGASEFLSTSLADNKMDLVNWSFDLTEATVWGFIFLVIFDTVLTFPKDQVLMQRVLSTSSAKNAGRSVWTFAAIVLPGSVLFYLVGTALYVFYQSHPERMDPSLSIDATFPLFIAAELPIGVTGLIIAGIFAASMSTLSSILNSVATTTTVDFYSKLLPNYTEKGAVRFAEIITIVSGVIGICLALLLTRFEIKSLLDLALELWGLLGGGFAGAYTLGMFTRRSNWQGVSIGVTVSIAITLAAWAVNLVHPYFYLPFSVCICIVVGYAASWLFPAPPELEGLTIYNEDTTA